MSNPFIEAHKKTYQANPLCWLEVDIPFHLASDFSKEVEKSLRSGESVYFLKDEFYTGLRSEQPINCYQSSLVKPISYDLYRKFSKTKEIYCSELFSGKQIYGTMYRHLIYMTQIEPLLKQNKKIRCTIDSIDYLILDNEIDFKKQVECLPINAEDNQQPLFFKGDIFNMSDIKEIEIEALLTASNPLIRLLAKDPLLFDELNKISSEMNLYATKLQELRQQAQKMTYQGFIPSGLRQRFSDQEIKLVSNIINTGVQDIRNHFEIASRLYTPGESLLKIQKSTIELFECYWKQK